MSPCAPLKTIRGFSLLINTFQGGVYLRGKLGKTLQGLPWPIGGGLLIRCWHYLISGHWSMSCPQVVFLPQNMALYVAFPSFDNDVFGCFWYLVMMSLTMGFHIEIGALCTSERLFWGSSSWAGSCNQTRPAGKSPNWPWRLIAGKIIELNAWFSSHVWSPYRMVFLNLCFRGMFNPTGFGEFKVETPTIATQIFLWVLQELEMHKWKPTAQVSLITCW